MDKPLQPDELCIWRVTYTNGRVRRTNYPYSQAEAERRFGADNCEPCLETRYVPKDGAYGGQATPTRPAD